MKLTKLEIRNFTVFEKADFSFASGINVFIGENGTGKSHVLKALYAILKGVRVPAADKSEEERWQRQRFAEIFKAGGGEPSAVGSLVRGSEDGAGATSSNSRFAIRWLGYSARGVERNTRQLALRFSSHS